MNRKAEGTTVIYADKPVRDYHYLGAFVFLALFLGVVTWLVFLYLETVNFRSVEDGVFLICLLVVGVLLGWVLFVKVKRLVDGAMERPLVRLDATGIRFFEDKLWAWDDIAYLRLFAEFDQHFLELKLSGSTELVCYRLYSGLETTEFADLAGFKAILDEYTDKVMI